MKRILLLLLLLSSLTGCSLAPDTYLSVKDHAASTVQTTQTDAVTVGDYASLKRAILRQVQSGQTVGTILTSNYDGDVEAELTQAVYEVAKLNPLGAYAVDYMTHDCTYIVNHYEITIRITFRRTLREIESVETVSTYSILQSRLEQALEDHETRLALRISSYRELDVAAMAAEYCAAHPDTIMEQPKVSVSVYPDSGTVRILEVDLTYTHSSSELERMRNAVRESVDAAAEYIRYRTGDREKTELLFTYLLERFTYDTGSTVTPLYDALCAGVADPAGLSQAWQLICDTAGVECYTVSGLKNGEPYTWNIVSHDGYFRHVDLAACVLEQGVLHLLDDREMNEYYWNFEQYPACELYQEEAVTQQPDAEPPAEEETPPAEQPAEEENQQP